MSLDVEPIQAWLRQALGEPQLDLGEATLLPGGAIQENWRIPVSGLDGLDAMVLRRDAKASIASSLPRDQEFALIQAAHQAGVTVPRPVAFCADPAIAGGPFALMGFASGTALGAKVVKDTRLGGDRTALLQRIGAEMARIHSITPPRPDLAFLGDPPACPAQSLITQMRAQLDRLGRVRPLLEWGLRWAELHQPAEQRCTLTHRDFRTGNYLVDEAGLTAVLDWEFCGWSDPMEDLGWFCAACWRFSRPDLEAGGIGPREPLYAGYRAGGGTLDEAAVPFWEIMAHLRWALIALEQGGRFTSGEEQTLETALTGRIAAELELAVIRALPPSAWEAKR